MQDEQLNSTLEQQAETAQADTTPKHEIEIMPSLEELLKQAELSAQEHHDAWLRAKADAENIRKRGQADVANAHKYAVENFSNELLAVKDSLEAALSVEAATVESLKSGVELTLKQLVSAFEKSSISELNPVNDKFDPHKHQAISMVDSDAAPNTVVTVLQKGYQLHDRILRPALVMVAKSKDA
ncbi:MAG: nucleotide exchange factor GrpE [Sulfuricellaceae bacterium]|nr:nucleotide exchange factor GrpE [Sulfuricellaceae bacterium]